MESPIAPNANMTVAATAAYRLTRGGAVEVHSLVQRVDQLVVTPRLSADVSSAVAGSPDVVEMILAQMSLEEMLRLASTSRVWAAATKLLVDRVLRVWESKEYWRNATVVGFKKRPTKVPFDAQRRDPELFELCVQLGDVPSNARRLVSDAIRARLILVLGAAALGCPVTYTLKVDRVQRLLLRWITIGPPSESMTAARRVLTELVPTHPFPQYMQDEALRPVVQLAYEARKFLTDVQVVLTLVRTAKVFTHIFGTCYSPSFVDILLDNLNILPSFDAQFTMVRDDRIRIVEGTLDVIALMKPTLELGEEPGQPRIVLLVDVTRRIIEVTLPEHAERINDAVLRCLDGINQPAAIAAVEEIKMNAAATKVDAAVAKIQAKARERATAPERRRTLDSVTIVYDHRGFELPV